MFMFMCLINVLSCLLEYDTLIPWSYQPSMVGMVCSGSRGLDLLFGGDASRPMARVVITGGCGFLGQALARSLLRRGSLLFHHHGTTEATAAIQDLVLVDVARPERFLFSELEQSARVEVGSIADASFCRELLSQRDASSPVSVFHLGAVMSGQGEADFDLCMDVNLHGTLNLLEAARHCGAPRPRIIMASAGATLGAGAPTDWLTKDDAVADSTRATPHTTYGTTKACGELLLADYSRRGFVDGRGCRLPSVVVRAGAPNAATTGCFSSVVREPLAGVDAVAPIGATVRHAVTSTRVAVGSLLGMHETPAATADAVLGYDRTVFVPSASVSLSELEAATCRLVAPSSRPLLGKVRHEERSPQPEPQPEASPHPQPYLYP